MLQLAETSVIGSVLVPLCDEPLDDVHGGEVKKRVKISGVQHQQGTAFSCQSGMHELGH